jgi:hypothetical protein
LLARSFEESRVQWVSQRACRVGKWWWKGLKCAAYHLLEKICTEFNKKNAFILIYTSIFQKENEKLKFVHIL